MSALRRRRSRLVSPRQLSAEVRRSRLQNGLTHADVAARVGLDEEEIHRAESPLWSPMIRTRKAILESLAGCTLDGPYYRVRPLDPESP